MHVLRDCVFAKNIWLLYTQSSLLSKFFTLPFQSWCKVNLSISCLSSYIPWSTVFAFTIWAIWLGRNLFIFEGRFVSHETLKCNVLSHATEFVCFCFCFFFFLFFFFVFCFFVFVFLHEDIRKRLSNGSLPRFLISL